MTIPRDVTQDMDPAPDPDDTAWPEQEPPRRPVDGTAESLHVAERPPDPVDENLGHTGELAKPQGRAEVENKANRLHAVITDPSDKHIGAMEEQVRTVPAPTGDAFKDEPKQG